MKYKVNPQFIDNACELSDELDINEVDASELLLLTDNDSARFDISHFQSAIAVFHVRRQYILGTLQFIFGNYVESGTLDTKIQSFIETIKSGPTSLFERILSGLTSVEQNLTLLAEKESRGSVLGQTESTVFMDQLKFQRDFLMSEHETLCFILHSLISRRDIKFDSDVIKLIQHVKKLDAYDTILIHYVPAIHAISLQLDPFFCTNPQPISTSTLINLAKEFKDPKSWKLQYWKGTVQFIFYTYAAGLIRSKSNENETVSIDYKADILDPVKSSIDSGAIELLLFIASDISPTKLTFEPFFDLRPELRFFVPEFKSTAKLSEEFLQLIYPSLEKVVEAVITNLADVLREMRLNEEDMHLANVQRDNYDNSDELTAGVDLERFFIFITCIYYDRPDSAISFWADQDGDLYNFIVWSSQCDIVIMATAFSCMLTALASGPVCALAVHRFLSESNSTKSTQRTKKVAQLSWDHIYMAITASINSLKPPQPPPSSLLLSKAKVIADIPKLVSSEVAILTTYLHILSQIVKYSPEAREELLLNSQTIEKGKESIALTQSFSSVKSFPINVTGTPASSKLAPSIANISPPPLPQNDLQLRPSTKVQSDRKPIVPTLFEFLSFYTPLFGPILTVFSGFALTTSQETKDNLWVALDQWLFNTTIAFPQNEYLSADVSPKERFFRIMNRYETVYGFITLIEILIRPSTKEDTGLFNLPFPENFGAKYRSPGLWPYVDFIINEIFLTTVTSTDMDKQLKTLIQRPTLSFILHCLEHFDPKVPTVAAGAGINLNAIVKAQSFNDYFLSHPSCSVMSLLFKSKVYTSLINLASVGTTFISEFPDTSSEVQNLTNSLKIIRSVLDLQKFFIDTVNRIGKSNETGPVHLSTHGLGSFEDAILFNLSLIPQLALYVSLPNAELARLSLQLLSRISQSSQFMGSSYSTIDSRIRGNRLLSILETVDESTSIKEGFIEQLERSEDEYTPVENGEELGLLLKEEILEFLIANMSVNTREASTAHLLLGFKINGNGSLSLDSSRCGILSEFSLFNSIVTIGLSAVNGTRDTQIWYRPSRIASLCYKIVQILMKSPCSSVLVFSVLREKEFLLEAVKYEPVVELNAAWDGLPFFDVPEFYFSDASKSFLSFIDKRTYLLECLSVEVHDAATNGSLSLVSRYIDALVNMNLEKVNLFDSSSATKILSFLDIMEFNIPMPCTIEDSDIASVFGENVIKQYYKHENEAGSKGAITELKYLLRLKGLEFVASGRIRSLDDPDFIVAVDSIIQRLARNSILDKLRKSQLAFLQSWCKLLLVLVNDSDMTSDDRINLTLETFHAVLHKLEIYSATDAEYATNLASLLVSLYGIYLNDVQTLESKSNTLLKTEASDRTYSLFKPTVASILSSASTSTLRTELYVIAYKYLQNVLEDDSLSPKSPIVQNCLRTIRSSGDKLIMAVTQDALNGEGTTILTAYILLEVLAHLCAKAHSEFLLETLVKYNLLLLIVKSISAADEEIVRSEDSIFFNSFGGNGNQFAVSNSDSTLNQKAKGSARRYYELMVYKAIVSLLLQLARTKSGAQQITQCGLFEILKTCKFLRIDPDVGVDVRQGFQSWLGLYSGNYTDNYKENSLFGGLNGKKAKFGSINSILNTSTQNSALSASSGASNFSSPGSVSAVTLYNLSRHDPQATFYDLVGPTFQLVTALLLSLGSENEPVISRVKSFLDSHELLVVALLRKDVLARGSAVKTSRLGSGLSDDIEAITGPLSASSGTKSSIFGESYGNNDYKNIKEEGLGDGDAELGNGFEANGDLVMTGTNNQQKVKLRKLTSVVNNIVLLISLTNYVPA